MTVPARRRPVPTEVAELESIMAQGWPAPEVVPLGQWLLRAAQGFTSRGNSVLCVGDPGQPREQAVAAAIDWYAARGLSAGFALPTDAAGAPYDGGLATFLTAAGSRTAYPTVAMTAPVARLPTTGEQPPAAWEVAWEMSWTPLPSPAWLAAFGRYRSVPAHQGEVARAILTGSPGQRFYTVVDAAPTPSGRGAPEVLASARVSLHKGWAGVHAMSVDPEHRRRGLATAVVASVADDIRAGTLTGVRALYLQVERDNDAAIAAYRSMGFTAHHGHVYLRPASAPGGHDGG